MKANEFLHKKDVAYMNRLSTSLDFDRIVSLMEEYAALRIHDVVGRSEPLTCECVELGSTECNKINDKWICCKCNRPLAG